MVRYLGLRGGCLLNKCINSHDHFDSVASEVCQGSAFPLQLQCMAGQFISVSSKLSEQSCQHAVWMQWARYMVYCYPISACTCWSVFIQAGDKHVLLSGDGFVEHFKAPPAIGQP